MILAWVFTGSFEGNDIAGVAHHADSRGVAAGRSTNIADGFGGEVEADGTHPDLLLGFDQGLGEGFYFGFGAS